MNEDDFKDQTGAGDLPIAEQARAQTGAATVNGTQPLSTEPLSENESLQRQVADCKAKADEWLDQYRRSVAEFSNYRKRQERERQQQTQRLSMDVMKKLLPAVDDLQRALRMMSIRESAPAESAEVSWVQGIQLIERKLTSVLAEFQVVPIQALGAPFDPVFHSALMEAESDTYPAGIVMEELQKGYLLGDQVLRPAVVKVSNGPGRSTDRTGARS